MSHWDFDAEPEETHSSGWKVEVTGTPIAQACNLRHCHLACFYPHWLASLKPHGLQKSEKSDSGA